MIKFFISLSPDGMIQGATDARGIEDLSQLPVNTITAYAEDWDNCQYSMIFLGGEQNEQGEYVKFETSDARPDDEHEYVIRNKKWILSDESTILQFKTLRNQALSASDWTQLPDTPTFGEDVTNWRQQLRDVTKISNNPTQWLEQVRQLITTPPTGIEIT